MLQESLKPLLQLSKRLDEKLPKFNAKVHSNNYNRNTSSGNCDELLNLKKNVDNMKADCQQTLLELAKRSHIFDQLKTCMDKSHEYLEACVSLMEGKLALKGYDPPKIEVKKSPELKPSNLPLQPIAPPQHCDVTVSIKQQAIVAPIRSQAVVNDETFCVKPVHLASAAPQVMPETQPSINNRRFDLPETPKSPVLSFMNAEKLKYINSPELPDLSRQEIAPESSSTSQQQSYFNTVLSPTVPELSLNSKLNEKKVNSLFPQLSSPVTPVLSTGPVKKRAANMYPKSGDLFLIKENESDDDDIVMHSRDSFMLSNQMLQEDPNSEDITVNLLTSKGFGKKLVSPETPELFGCTASKSTSLYANNPYKINDQQQSFQAPNTPELSQLEPPVSKRSPTICAAQYNGLSNHIKRLVSFEQANLALKRCYKQSKLKSSHCLSAAEIENAINLGGRNKCCLLMLKSLNFIKKIAGADKYEICD